MPLIDILIPAYNCEMTIRESVQCMLDQSVRDIEIHVINDGSTDTTGTILTDMARADTRLHVHTQANGGIVEALNHGLKFCTAPYIARHDGDDIAYPNRLEKQLAYLQANADCVAVGSQVRHIDGTGRLTGSVSNVSSPETSDPYSYPAREPYIIHPFLMMRRDAVIAAGGYRYAHHCEDTDLYWRLQHIGRLHNLDEILGEYRLHAGSISGSSLKNGRLMAVFSQLTAISEQRRRNGRIDIVFDQALIQAAKGKHSLEEIIETCIETAALDAVEGQYLRTAACAKLLELTSYRPYDLESSDTQYIGRSVKIFDREKGRANRNVMTRQLTGIAANLALKGQIESALSLLTVKDVPAFLYRLGLRVALPPTLRQKLRSLSGNNGPAK